MRLWHQSLIDKLDNKRLLGQHRECCALRGKGWGKKHATVDYVFKHPAEWLVAYHMLVLEEMRRRGYKPGSIWYTSGYRGKNLNIDYKFADPDITDDQFAYATHKGGIIYAEHNDSYLVECINNLKNKGITLEI